VADALDDAVSTDQVTDQVRRVIGALAGGELGATALMMALGLSHRSTFRQSHLNPAIAGGWVTPTQPDSLRSPTQRYRFTARARRWMDSSGQMP
jgi:hypothetical protein